MNLELKKLPDGLNLSKAFSEEPREPDFVLPGLVAGSVGALVSPGATGKSLWALAIGATVAGCSDILGIGIKKKGKVLVICAEDPETILSGRLHRLAKKMSPADQEAVIERLDVMPAMAIGIDFFSPDGTAWAQAIIERAKDCRLIIIDTLSRVHTGDENERKDAARVMRLLEYIAARTGAAVLFLHHITKSVALGGQGDQQQAARGSSVWIDESRWAAFLKTMDDKEAKEWPVDADFRRSYVRYGVNKANYCAPIMDIWLKRDECGVLVPAGLVKGKSSEARGQLSKAAEFAAAFGVEVCNDPSSL